MQHVLCNFAILQERQKAVSFNVRFNMLRELRKTDSRIQFIHYLLLALTTYPWSNDELVNLKLCDVKYLDNDHLTLSLIGFIIVSPTSVSI